MNALKLWRYYADAAIIIVAVAFTVAAPFIGAHLADTPAGVMLVGFLGVMAGFALTVGTVALDWIVRDARRAARR